VETWEWIVVGAAAGVLVLLVAGLMRIKRRRAHLEERFGTEYHRTVSGQGRATAERRLSEIEQRREELDVRPLPAAARERYLEEWRHAEARFVHDPRDAVRTAERVVMRVLSDRGYEVDGDDDDFERRVELVAVDHPNVAERYRHGHAMLGHVDGAEATEHLRKAMVDFRVVLDELLESDRAAVA
jgi:hypothetical protein